jgi:multicomponent Na+:H+ antiporter subunit G
MDAVLDVVSVVFLLAGCAFALFAGLGLLRFPDVVSRLHAGTKPQVAGVLLIMIGSTIRLAGSPVVWMLLIAGFLQLLTAPVSAHMVSRIAYKRRHVRQDLLVVHEAGFAGLERPAAADEARGDAPAEAPETPPSGHSS